MLVPMEEYLFDLRGYLILKGAVSKDRVYRINDHADEFLEAGPDEDD